MRRGGQPKEEVKSNTGLTRAQRSNFLLLTARGYAAWRARSLSLLAGEAFPLSREAALFLGLARPAPGEAWLDVGTSAGFYAGVLAGAGARVLAVDLSPAMLAEARRREPSDRVSWALLNAEDTGLPDAAFDGVTIGATLNETARPWRLLAEAQRLLRPGGRLWLMYAARGGGTPAHLLARLGGLLARLGGLTFPDPAEVERALPGCAAAHGVVFGGVAFQLFVRKSDVPTPPRS